MTFASHASVALALRGFADPITRIGLHSPRLPSCSGSPSKAQFRGTSGPRYFAEIDKAATCVFYGHWGLVREAVHRAPSSPLHLQRLSLQFADPAQPHETQSGLAEPLSVSRYTRSALRSRFRITLHPPSNAPNQQ